MFFFPVTILSSGRVSTLVPQATGTAIGGGGLSTDPGNAFDNSETTYASGSGNTAGYIGKDWGVGNAKVACRAIAKSTTTRSFAAASPVYTFTMYLEGSQDGSNWTTIDSVADTDATSATQKSVDMTTSNTSVAYRYHRVRFVFSGAASIRVSEVNFYELVG